MRKIDTRTFTRATRATGREINRRILLNLVREHQPISRADLARRMSMGRGMVTSLTSELIAEGALVEGSTGEAARGRKPVMLYVRTGDRLAVAIDVRFTRTYVMLSDFAGEQVGMDSFETVFSPGPLIEELARRVDLLVRAHAGRGRVEGIGVVVAGMIDRRSGTVLNSPQLGWRDVPLREGLSLATGLPVEIENAPIACAVATQWLGRRGDGGLSDFVYVTVSDGVGAGVVVNGQVVRGHDQIAGEFGHVPLQLDGPECLCGARGCWEAYASNLATLARYLGREPSAAESRRLLGQRDLTFGDLISRAKGGEQRARDALRESGRYLGLGLASIINALNPARIYVGGEITAVWELIEAEVGAAIGSRALTLAAARTPIVPDRPAVHPRLLGATALVAAPLFSAPQVG
jgi:N-acetylglucosamine repressor